MNLEAVKTYFTGLQERIVSILETADGKTFRRDGWERPEGGGGLTCLVEEGKVLERGGVNFSHVFGAGLPPSATAARPDLAGRSFQALGVSLVLHPRNPYAPTAHMNVRFFVAEKPGAEPVWWFGGGMDLTPYYGFSQDAVHFHRTCKTALERFGAQYHPRFKKWCDEYFYLRHRQEPRGVGGIFFDDFNEPGFDLSLALTQSVGDHFLPAYLPILQRRKDHPYGERERDFQPITGGAATWSSTWFDRGTLSASQSGGRTESILMSLPPVVKWRYDWRPEPGSPKKSSTPSFWWPRIGHDAGRRTWYAYSPRKACRTWGLLGKA